MRLHAHRRGRPASRDQSLALPQQTELTPTMLAVVPDGHGDPESLLIDAEEAYQAAQDAPGGPPEPPVDPRLPLVSGDALQGLLERLPPEYADCIDLYFVRGLSQSEVGQVQGCSQAGVSYRLARAVRALRWLMTFGALFTVDDVSRDLSAFLSPVELRAIEIFWYTTCASEAARQTGLEQTRVSSITRWLRREVLPGLVRANPETYTRYLVGFTELQRQGAVLWRPKGGRWSTDEGKAWIRNSARTQWARRKAEAAQEDGAGR